MLDDAIVGVWEGLAAHRVVQCLVCGEDMAPQYAAHSRPVGGLCNSCGTTLR
jgi:ribosomal protein S27E